MQHETHFNEPLAQSVALSRSVDLARRPLSPEGTLNQLNTPNQLNRLTLPNQLTTTIIVS